jgi:hypothetical protein
VKKDKKVDDNKKAPVAQLKKKKVPSSKKKEKATEIDGDGDDERRTFRFGSEG